MAVIATLGPVSTERFSNKDCSTGKIATVHMMTWATRRPIPRLKASRGWFSQAAVYLKTHGLLNIDTPPGNLGGYGNAGFWRIVCYCELACA